MKGQARKKSPRRLQVKQSENLVAAVAAVAAAVAAAVVVVAVAVAAVAGE